MVNNGESLNSYPLVMTNIAIENGITLPIYSGFSDERLWFSIIMLVYQRVSFPDFQLFALADATWHYLTINIYGDLADKTN